MEEATLDGHRLVCGTAEAVLPTLPDASVHLIIADPPYRNVKQAAWDRQWKTRDAYLTWLKNIALAWRRILTPNGSLYCFASPQMAAHIEVMLGNVFNVIQRITWAKPPFTTKAEMFDKDTCRMYFPASEAIVFCEQQHSDSLALRDSDYAGQCDQLRGWVFEPIRAYLEGERQRAGIHKAAINAACGFAPIAGAMASRHYFSASQWQLPTAAHYAAMQQLFNRQGQQPPPPFCEYHPKGSPFAKFHANAHEFLRADYEGLRREYEGLRRPFTVSPSVPYTDVWTFPTVQATPGKHECEKPIGMLRHIVMASSRPGDVVLDCFAGSHATSDAARQCGRTAIAIEQDPYWWTKGQQRLRQEELFRLPATPVKTPAPQQQRFF